MPDPGRVIARPFLPGAPAFGDGPSRVHTIVDRLLAIPPGRVPAELERVRAGFQDRHHDLEATWALNATTALALAGAHDDEVDPAVHALIGAYFTQEYAVEAAAICNPSMVPAPGSQGEGEFVMSMRAIGEGHISSVEFRTGRVGPAGAVVVDPPAATLTPGRRRSPTYAKEEFGTRLAESNPDPVITSAILGRLGDHFSIDDMDKAISDVTRSGVSEAALAHTRHLIHWVATSNYEVEFDAGNLSQRVLVPAGPADSHGIEDVRWVRFTEDDGTVTFYGTYTAFDGTHILPQLIETEDFATFRVATVSGPGARNKGMALFPRRIDGEFVALGRADRENIHVLRSRRIRHWERHQVVYGPLEPWEMIQVGNSGPPIETPAGWLVITHGVGPMRRYAIGAALLDLERPERLLARSRQPLLEPEPDERDGYVPNVVYSCGGMLSGETLVLPYGFSDRAIGIALMEVDEILASLAPV